MQEAKGVDQPDLEELRAIMADIRRDDHRASNVIERLRGLMERKHLQSASLDIGSLIGETVSLVRAEAAHHRVTLSTDVSAGLLPVMGDRVHLQQVLLNLLVNAIDAVKGQPECERRVEVSARVTDAGMIEVRVRDSGSGIRPEDMTRLFDSFFTSKPHGLGMGLSICRTIIEAHGGRIKAGNNADRGATFRLTLPAEAASQAA